MTIPLRKHVKFVHILASHAQAHQHHALLVIAPGIYSLSQFYSANAKQELSKMVLRVIPVFHLVLSVAIKQHALFASRELIEI